MMRAWVWCWAEGTGTAVISGLRRIAEVIREVEDLPGALVGVVERVLGRPANAEVHKI